MNTNLKSLSKFMSLVLRHKPEEIGIKLDANGWVSIEDLVLKSNGKLTDETIRSIVEQNDKKRFAISDDGKSVRANQGHSVNIDLDLRPTEPPEILYHGTASRFLDSIKSEGLKSQSRQHVHLSLEIETAKSVGQRYGKPVILEIDAHQMHQDGILFYVSKNGVWLTQSVPVKYISF